jgi:anti-sigma regulatory factor (Ser/Thr protein kinase)
MKIHLPNSAFLGNIDPFLRSFDTSKPEELEISANKKWISVHPAVLSMIAALGLNASKITFENLEATSKHYLERMHLFKFLKIDSGIKITEHEPAGRFIPITQIKTSDELSRFITEIVPLLHLEPVQAEPIKYVISELVRNVLEHASTQNGALLCAQFYPKSNCIRIGIADTGVGIKKTINQSHPANTHLEAIRLALMPGITGTTSKEGGTEFNAGAGLFFIKSMATVNRDFFLIYSGNAMYKLLKSPMNKKKSLNTNPFDDRHSEGEDYPLWRGTVVGIDITLEPQEEFTQLLSLIRETYSKAIRERKNQKYKRPRFI